jgi:hypothetical protein
MGPFNKRLHSLDNITNTSLRKGPRQFYNLVGHGKDKRTFKHAEDVLT